MYQDCVENVSRGVRRCPGQLAEDGHSACCLSKRSSRQSKEVSHRPGSGLEASDRQA